MAMLTPLPKNFAQPIRSAIAEAYGMSWEDLAPVMIHFRTTLDNTTSSDSDYFRVDGGRTLLVWEMRGHLGMNQMSTEPLSTTVTSLMSLPGAKNRAIVKAMNARITMTLPDMESTPLVETDVSGTGIGTSVTLPLSTLMPLCGGAPVKWVDGNDVMPLIVPEDQRIKVGVTLTDVTLAGGVSPAGLQTEYGVTFIGALVRSRAV